MRRGERYAGMRHTALLRHHHARQTKLRIGVDGIALRIMPSPYPKDRSTALPLPMEGDEFPLTNTGSRTCKACGMEKSLLEFYTDRDGHQYLCKPCANHNNRVRSKIRRHAPPKPDRCECCGEVPTSRWCMDHDHETEAFRGWICERCNIGLGKFGDNIEGLMKAISYLRRSGKEESHGS